MLSMETEMKLLFPTIMRYKPNDIRFVGIFKTQQNDNIFASFSVPNYPKTLGITFEIGIEIREPIYKNLISKSDDLNFLEFLKEFQQVVLTCPKQKTFKSKLFERFNHEIRDLRQLNRNEQFNFDATNETLTVIHKDDYNIENYFVVKLNFYNEDCQLYEVIKHNFPSSKDEKLFHGQCSLRLLHKTFLSVIQCLGSYHEAIQKIDSVCWITAPKNPNHECTYRTIVIGENNVTMKIIFNPWNMLAIPELRFFGPSNVIQQHKDTLSTNLSNWEADGDIIQNILRVLDLPFLPVKPTTSGTENELETTLVLYDSETECCVCFSYYLNDETPSIRCDNESCRRHFHQNCLFEWLSRIQNNIYFGNISGPCPICEKTISCSVLDK